MEKDKDQKKQGQKDDDGRPKETGEERFKRLGGKILPPESGVKVRIYPHRPGPLDPRKK